MCGRSTGNDEQRQNFDGEVELAVIFSHEQHRASMLREIQIHCAAESHDCPWHCSGHRFTLQSLAAICTSIVVGQLETHICG